MSEYIDELEVLIEQMRKLPGVGKKSATRMAFGIVDMSEDQVDRFLNSIKEAKSNIRTCKQCGNIANSDICSICADAKRDNGVICVVEDVKALIAMEKVRTYNGVFHVLNGTISPMDGRGPDDINIQSLLDRISAGNVREVILATNPTRDGETTAIYLSKLLKPLGVCTTRLASGIPVGGDLDYADEMTLLHAIDGRKEM